MSFSIASVSNGFKPGLGLCFLSKLKITGQGRCMTHKKQLSEAIENTSKKKKIMANVLISILHIRAGFK